MTQIETICLTIVVSLLIWGITHLVCKGLE